MNIAPDYPDYTYPEYCQMKREERDKFLAKTISICLNYNPDHNGECLNCDEWADSHITSFSTWEGLGKLWEWCTENDFKLGMHVPCYLINPDKFADAVYKYLNETI